MPQAATSTDTERASSAALWRWFAPILGGAALVFAFVLYSVLHHSSTKTHARGPFALECREPVDDVAQWVDFRARGAKPSNGWYRFEVRDASAPVDSKPLLVHDKSGETKWTPTQAELERLPAKIRWRVAAIDAEGIERDADETTAWLRR